MGNHDKQPQHDRSTTGTMPRDTSQVGTHGNAPNDLTDKTRTSQGGWDDRSTREMEQGDRTKPAMPDGTTPLERNEAPPNQRR